MMLRCTGKNCKNKSYVPKKTVERHNLKDIICHEHAQKIQTDILSSMSKKDLNKLVKEVEYNDI